MKKLFFFVATLLATYMSNAQSGWKIQSGTKALNIATLGTETMAVDISIPLTISYQPAKPNHELTRSIMFFNATGNQEIKRFEFKDDNGTISIGTNDLAKIFAQNSKVFLNTMAIPKDPEKAALVRVGRTQVCILTKSETSLKPKPMKKKKKIKYKKKSS